MKMNYFVVGTNDIEAATTFYTSLFAKYDLQCMSPTERMTYWVGDDFAFAVAIPFDTKPASVGNGMMVGFSTGSKEEVSELHALALRLGACCAGEPGQRGPRFSAYIRDLDGNKLCISD